MPRDSQTTTDPESLSTAWALSILSEYTYTLDSLPIDISRNFADLRELDAVLSTSMASVTDKIVRLTKIIEAGIAPKEERLWLLTEITEEVSRLKPGADDKIRVASQAADAIKSHATHLTALSEHIPGFDASILKRHTTYPHVASKPFMPLGGIEGGRRRRNAAHGSLLVSQSETSPAKIKKRGRDDEIDTRSPRQSKPDVASGRRNGRAKNRAASPADSVYSTITSQPGNPAGSSRTPSATNNVSRANGQGVPNKRARANNRGASPTENDDRNANNSEYNQTLSSRRDFNVPSSSSHPSLPQPFQGNGQPYGTSNGLGNGLDVHSNQPLVGPGMPVSRHSSYAPTSSAPVDNGDDKDNDGDNDDGKTYCFCNRVSYGEMIACDDNQCDIEWFHLTCIGLSVPPEGRWFCDNCRSKRSAVKRTGRGGKRRAGGRGNGRSASGT